MRAALPKNRRVAAHSALTRNTTAPPDSRPRDCDGLVDSNTTGLPSAVTRALADPIVKALMAADRIETNSVAALMRRMAARLQRLTRVVQGGSEW